MKAEASLPFTLVGRRGRAALSFAILGGLHGAAGPGAAQQGVVHVTFSVEAPFFGDLPETVRQEVEARLARIVVAWGEEEYRFLSWESDDGSLPRLGVHVVEDRSVSPPSVCPPKLDLRFFGVPSSGDQLPLPGEARAITLYEACSLVSAADTSALRARVQVVLDSAFQSTTFRAQLETGLINLVPFADRVEPAQQQVLLPVPCREILLGEASRLTVHFVDRDPADGSERDDGRLRLHDPIATQAGAAFSLTPTASTDLARFAEADEDGRLIRLRVFMQEYHKSLDCLRIAEVP